MLALAVPLHMGVLHPMESLMMAALTLGPFVVLATAVTLVSRRDRRTEPDHRRKQGRDPAGQATRAAGAERPDAAMSTANETAAPQSVQQ